MPEVIVIASTWSDPSAAFKSVNVLQYRPQFFRDNFFKGIRIDFRFERFVVMMNDFSPLLGPENFFIHGDFHHNAGKRIIMPREAGPYFESFLISRVRAPFLIAFTDNINGFFQESLLNDLARFPNGIFHVIASGSRGESGKIQVLGKAIIIEITFPESRTPPP